TLGLVGESGCGKTTTGRLLTRILKPTAGSIEYHQADGGTDDIAGLEGPALKAFRRDIRMIFQDPFSSLNLRLPVLDIIGQSLSAYGVATGAKREQMVAELLEEVGLRPEYIRRYPHAFSGGERQRIGIARALALRPRLIVADEAVSALDVSVQAQTLNLLNRLKAKYNLTYVFVAHDLSVVEYICDRVAVMYVGKIVEIGDRDSIFRKPLHPYTEALMSAVPQPDPNLRGKRRRVRLKGEVADPANPPTGCYFHPRCAHATDRCKTEAPPLRDMGNGHKSACHYAGELNLSGALTMAAPGQFTGEPA
ncbi:MAG: ATP-binding cassette domain-containing protein, partial [Gammaproteobacteria bacterium]|nr:ATP-binding cassette domain-containing protein [Gammaproteobacteria bacterium]